MVKETKTTPKKELFEVSCHVYEEGENVRFEVTYKKDGKQTEINIMDDNQLYISAKGLEYATGLMARMYVERQFAAGKMDKETYEGIMKTKQ